MKMDGTKVKNNLFCKYQRIVSDAYRENYDRIFKKENKNKKSSRSAKASGFPHS